MEYLNFKSKDFPKENYGEFFDIAFIDGNHKVDKIIQKDFEICKYMLKPNGIIIFDDYGPDWAVTRVVNHIIETNADYIFTLINTCSNLPNHGHVIMSPKDNDILKDFFVDS